MFPLCTSLPLAVSWGHIYHEDKIKEPRPEVGIMLKGQLLLLDMAGHIVLERNLHALLAEAGRSPLFSFSDEAILNLWDCVYTTAPLASEKGNCAQSILGK